MCSATMRILPPFGASAVASSGPFCPFVRSFFSFEFFFDLSWFVEIRARDALEERDDTGARVSLTLTDGVSLLAPLLLSM